MKITPKRRYLLKLSGIFILFGCIFYPQSVKGQAAHGCQDKIVNWNTQAFQKKNDYKFQIDSKFSSAQENLIRNALKIAVERIQDNEVWQQVKSTYGFAFPTPKTINNSGLCSNLEIRRNILFHQLYYLSVPEANELSATKFPDIEITFRNEPPAEGELGWLGKARYDVVNVYWSNARNRWQKSGSFKVAINAHFLFKNKIYSNSEYWAGIVAHEMAHNLGHRHPKSTHPDYKKYQINVLATAIQNYGQSYAGPSRPRFPVYACNEEYKSEKQ